MVIQTVARDFVHLRPHVPAAEVGSGLVLPQKTIDRLGSEGIGEVLALGIGDPAIYGGIRPGSLVLYRRFYQDVHLLGDGTCFIHRGDLLAELSGSGSVGYGELNFQTDG